MRISKTGMKPSDVAAMENAAAQAAKNQATIEYVAMMADVELPEEEGSENDVSED